MKISVIIPFRNAEAHLGRCIESCKKAPGDFEFILVDDNDSIIHAERKDTTLAQNAVVESHRFIYKRSFGLGVSVARNAGIVYATGEWLTFLDADDELLTDAREVMEQAIARAEDHPIIQLNHLRYYKEIDKLTCKHANKPGTYTLEKLPECWCMVWNKLIKAEWLNANRIGFKQGLQYGEDELFNLELLRKHPAIKHAELRQWAVKRNFDNKQSLSHSKGKEELRTQIEALEEFLVQLGDNEKEMKSFVMDLIAEHWKSPTYKRIIGGIE